jgi:hypothetical protein
MSNLRPNDFARDKRTRKVGRVLRIKGEMVELKFPDRRATVIINSSFLEKV